MNLNIYGAGIKIGVKKLTEDEIDAINCLIDGDAVLPKDFVSTLEVYTYPCTSDLNIQNLDSKERIESSPEIVRPLYTDKLMGESGYYLLIQGESFYSNMLMNKIVSSQDLMSCKSLEYDFDFFSADIVKEISVDGEDVDLGIESIDDVDPDIYLIRVDDDSTNLIYRNGVWYC